MNDILKSAAPALIALVGTGLTVFIGYRQWRRSQDTSREAEFRTQKQQTYKELWEKLEEVHIQLRTKVVGSDEFSSLVRDVNSYILKHGLYLENGDQELANRYLSKVREFTSLVAASDSADAKVSVSKTGAIPAEVVRYAQELGRIQSEVNQIREDVLARYRKVLSGSDTR